MSKKPKFGTDSPDPRTRTVEALKVGDMVAGSALRHKKPQRRDGINGYRLVLWDKRSTWAEGLVPVSVVRDRFA